MKRFLIVAIGIVLVITPLAASAADWNGLFNSKSSSVVTILSGDSQGTGFYITENLIATNFHVIKALRDIRLFNNYKDGPTQIEYIVDIDTSNDLAILYTEKTGTPLNLDSARKVETGMAIAVIGSPKGQEKTITEGLCNGMRGDGSLQISAAVSPGSSGSPVFNQSGFVIGVVTWQKEGQNINFAMPSEKLASLLARAESKPMDKYHKVGSTSVQDITGVDTSKTSPVGNDYVGIDYNLPSCNKFESIYFENPKHGPVKKCTCNSSIVLTNVFCQCHPCRP